MDLQELADERGFTVAELEKYEITVDGGVVVLPYLGRLGSWYDRLYRPHGKPKYESPKGSVAHLYNPEGYGPNVGEVWIAEGEFDCLSLLVAGVSAVGVAGANNWKPEWCLLFEGARVILALDPDEAGQEAMNRIEGWFFRRGTRVDRFDPSPYGDLNDWFKDDRKGFTNAVLEF